MNHRGRRRTQKMSCGIGERDNQFSLPPSEAVSLHFETLTPNQVRHQPQGGGPNQSLGQRPRRRTSFKSSPEGAIQSTAILRFLSDTRETKYNATASSEEGTQRLPASWSRNRYRVVIPAFILLLAGCGSPPNKGKGGENKKEKDLSQLSQTVESSSGNATSKGPPPKRESLWYVEWKKASIHLQPNAIPGADSVGISTGNMEGVRGNLFEGEKPGSTFSADTGSADTMKRILTLEGNVHLHSSNPDAELTCDRVVYDAGKEVVRAIGHVRIEGKVGTIGTLSEILATKDLKRIATPGMFYKK